MESRERTILNDGSVPDLRGGSYRSLLSSTSWTMICLIAAHVRRPTGINDASSQTSVRRAMTALTQLPSEWAGSDNRFDHARWRSSTVLPGGVQRLHAEHPWSKSKTKKMVVAAVEAALVRGAQEDSLIADVGEILDARMDTVLLPSSDLASQGIILETRGDGLRRYADAVGTGRLLIVDRYTGSTMTREEIVDEDESRSRRVQSAIHRITMG